MWRAFEQFGLFALTDTVALVFLLLETLGRALSCQHGLGFLVLMLQSRCMGQFAAWGRRFLLFHLSLRLMDLLKRLQRDTLEWFAPITLALTAILLVSRRTLLG